jgi:excisionase family DNA binding protein
MAGPDKDDPEAWPAWLKTTEVAEILRVSRPTVRSMMQRGELTGRLVGRQWRIPASEVRRVLGLDESQR